MGATPVLPHRRDAATRVVRDRERSRPLLPLPIQPSRHAVSTLASWVTSSRTTHVPLPMSDRVAVVVARAAAIPAAAREELTQVTVATWALQARQAAAATAMGVMVAPAQAVLVQVLSVVKDPAHNRPLPAFHSSRPPVTR